MKTFCVIPAYKEEKNIEKTIKEALPYVDHLVIVDDFSQDNTLNIVKSIKNDKLSVLSHPINLGQGAALETGNKYALQQGADIIIHFDGDGQFLAQDIPKFIHYIKNENYDIVFGSRFLEIKSDIPYFKRNIIMPIAKLFNLVFFNIKTSDPQIGFRALNRKSAQIIQIEHNRMAHCTEILAKAFKYKLKIKEIPVKVLYHEFGQNMSGGFKIISDFFFNKISK